ncbi:MAG: uncharacterized protein QOC92_3546 [Acidimicrobiaceae bacterium]|jgi:uncharacterized OB-fold protein
MALYLDGLPLPTVDRTNAGFWQAAAEGRLDLQRCAMCGWHRHPPTEGCFHCGSMDWGWDTLPGTGEVFTYTWVAQAIHPGVADRVPYNVVVVQLDGVNGDPVRLVSNCVDATDDTLQVGSRVDLVCERVNDEIGLPLFRLA